MTTRGKIGAVLVMAAFLLPNLCCIYLGTESFPYTNAPMFAHYIGETTRFYDITFIGEAGDSTRRVIPYYGTPKQTANYVDMRFFFNNIYGSVEKESPFGYLAHDTRAAFEARMNAFFLAYFRYLLADHPVIKRVRCEVSQYNSRQQLLSSHTIGYYDVVRRKFEHTWK